MSQPRTPKVSSPFPHFLLCFWRLRGLSRVACAALITLVAKPVFAEYDIAPFIDWLEETQDEAGIPGSAVAIVSRDKVLYMHTWGHRKVDSAPLVTSNSLFRIASMSKTFAGAAATLVVDSRQQAWDAKMSDILPSLHLGNGRSYRDITFRQVASHSTGLMPHSYSNLLDDGVDYAKIKPRFADIPAVCKPGTCYGYQNVVFSLIADVVEQTTGEGYDKFLEEKLFRPLGMTTASVGLEPYVQSADATSPHRRVRGSWRPTSTNPAYYSAAPAAGINASVFDMALWVRANLGGFPEVLTPDFLNELHTPVIETPQGNYFNRWQGLEKAYYGIGWRVFDIEGVRVVHHGGGVRGYRSEMAFIPEADIGMVVLFNGETNVANDAVPMFLKGLR